MSDTGDPMDNPADGGVRSSLQNNQIVNVLRVAERLDELSERSVSTPEQRLARAEAAIWIRAAVEEAGE